MSNADAFTPGSGGAVATLTGSVSASPGGGIVGGMPVSDAQRRGSAAPRGSVAGSSGLWLKGELS